METGPRDAALPDTGPRSPPARWALHRFLNLFTEVRSGEAAFSLLLTFGAFLLLTAYYVLKTVREPLILTADLGRLSGQELKIYAAAGQSLFFCVAVPFYARLARRTDRLRLINVMVVFFVASLVLLNLLGHAGVPIGVPFFLWLGILSMMLIAQFWSLANDVCTPEQGMRLFALIATGGSLGSIAGAAMARWLIAPLGVLPLMLVGALLLAVDLAVFNVVIRVTAKARRSAAGSETAADPPAQSPVGGFGLVRRSRYLLLIAGMLLIGSLVNTQGEFILADAVKENAEQRVPDGAHSELADDARHGAVKAERQQIIARFYGEFYATVNLIAFLLQAFLVSRIMNVFGMRLALMTLPVLALGGYGLIAWAPTLLVVGLAKLGENSTDYSLHNTVRQALFLPTSREEKYDAKLATDTFFVRFGDMLAAVAVYAGLHLVGLSRAGFALVNVSLAAIWLLVTLAIGAYYRRFSD